MVPRLPPPYLHPAKNLQHATAWGGRAEGKQRAGRRKFGVKRAKAAGILGPLLAGPGTKRGCSERCTMERLQRSQTLPTMLESKFLYTCSTVISEPPTKHQHCAHQRKWLPSLAELYIYRYDPHLPASSQKMQSTLWYSGDFGL